MSNLERMAKDKTDWLEKHKDADRLVFDEISKLPIRAEYDYPLGKFVYDKLRSASRPTAESTDLKSV